MSDDDEPGVIAEKGTGLMHVLKSALPATKLAPWMSIHRRNMLMVIGEEMTAGKIADLLERQTYLHSLDEEKRKEEMEEGEILITDANTMFATCLAIDAQVTHDLAPSEGGLRTRQAFGLGSAQKTGMYNEPKARTWSDKLLRKNKPEQQTSAVSK